MRQKNITILIFLLLIGLSACGVQKENPTGIADLTLAEGIHNIAKLSEQGTLRVAVMSLTDGGVLQQAVSIFEERYPGWTVEISVYEHMAENSDFDQQLLQFKEEVPRLMREGRVDLVDMTRLPLSPLRDAGLLLDLHSLLQEESNISLDQLLPGVRDILDKESDNGLYYMPANCYVYYLSKNSAYALERLDKPLAGWAWGEVADWFAEDTERLMISPLFNETPESLLRVLLRHEYDYFTHEDTYDFTSPVFREVLDTAKQLHEKKLLLESNASNTNSRSLLVVSAFIGGIQNYKTMQANYVSCYPLPEITGTAGKALMLEDTFAINAKSDHPAAAWELLKIMVFEEMLDTSEPQNIRRIYRESVLNELSKEGILQKVGGQLSVDGVISGAEPTDEMFAAYNKERQAFYADVNRAIASRTHHEDISSIVACAIPYITGEVPYQECLKNLEEAFTK